VALPLYDNQPTRRAPLVTYLLIAANVVVFLLSPIASIGHSGEPAGQRQCEQATFLLKYAAVPKELIDNRQQPLPPDIELSCAPKPYHKRPWFSALASMFGASGAIAGVLGSHLVLYPRSKTITLLLSVIPFRLPSWALLAQFFVIQWFSLGHQSATAYVAHIYGFVAGVICGLIVRRGGLARKSAALSWQ
jgi:membrane associated rhomboid family serine protease